ncbi:chromate transporter [Rhodoligotrophos appendicifer]|uniref:chromate efflux transporter n=1 Tax=Rhodoligotrophos appendicifer TaxID=987056 RepID=UPI001185B96E|nr:chromate efflux transporter [Rhodoligotrophos appendicifer]
MKSVAGSLPEIFFAFLKLGLTSFGGPIAHLGYLRAELVTRRKWLDDAGYADLVALCQFLPGPASSQVGFALGVLRHRGVLGGLAAWTAFTLPSAILMIGFAYGSTALEGRWGAGLVHGLKLVAVAVVAQAVYGMARSLTPDRQRAAIALAAAVIVLFFSTSAGQILSLLLGAAAGLWLCRSREHTEFVSHQFSISHRAGAVALILFLSLLVLLPAWAATGSNRAVELFDAFYRAGALVFGGGHVVLPLLQAEVVPPGWITNPVFLTGYGLAQAVPGPLFSFAAYLGALMPVSPNGVTGALLALTALFLPGLLLVYGMLPFWDFLRQRRLVQAGMRGANAAVVGILAAALYDPLWTSAVLTPQDFAAALAGFLLLTVWSAPPILVVALLSTTGIALG